MEFRDSELLKSEIMNSFKTFLTAPVGEKYEPLEKESV